MFSLMEYIYFLNEFFGILHTPLALMHFYKAEHSAYIIMEPTLGIIFLFIS
jgi:hypothetical protein